MSDFLKSNWLYFSILTLVLFSTLCSVCSIIFDIFKHIYEWHFFVSFFCTFINIFNFSYIAYSLIIKWRKLYEKLELNLNPEKDPELANWCKENKIKVDFFWKAVPDGSSYSYYVIIKNIFNYEKKLMFLRLKL